MSMRRSEPGQAPPVALVDDQGMVAALDLASTPSWWGRIHHQIVIRHSLALEIFIMACVYGIYDGARGLVSGGAATAYRNARSVARWEKDLHVFVEPHIQNVLTRVPGLTTWFGIGYDTFHLGVTAAVLLWLYWRRPHLFARVRTLLAVTSLLALIGFTCFPTAPPRLAGVGIKDTLHLGRATAETGWLQWLYNPYAAVPSLHMGFALIAGGSVLLFARRRWMRIVGLIYPIDITAEVLATGNHFLFDVVTGIVTVFLAFAIMIPLAGEGEDARIGRAFRLVAARFTDLFRPARPVVTRSVASQNVPV
jgi:PAP2 superfamily